MCDIFATSSEYILFGKVLKQLTEDEQKLIDAYRKADPAMQGATRKLLDVSETEQERSSVSRTG